jgi:4-hydroxy-tetrahydrodipicolinate reductase
VDYALIGYGRMGRAVEQQAARRGHTCRAVVDGPEATLDPAQLGKVRVAFEFTRAGAAERNLVVLLEAGISVVCGTTGWEPSTTLIGLARRADAALVLAPNFSVGVHLFFRIVAHASRALGALGLHDPFIEEAHHRGKVDAPSGTARRLAAILLAEDPRLVAVAEGPPAGRLPPGVLPIASTRAGSEPGMHRVGFDGEHELILVEHRARGREGFALGAVLAAEWIEGRRGLQRFEDVVDGILRGERRAEGGTR